LNLETFNEIKNLRKNNEISWQEVADKYGFISSEAARCSYKRYKWQVADTSEVTGTKVVYKENKTNAKILCLDIETSPICSLGWSLWPDSIQPEAIIQDWHMLSWSARWLFSSETMSDCLTSDEAVNHTDARISNSIWKLLDEASVVVSHNGNQFDIKRLNTRFLYNGLFPPTPYQSIDTLVVAKSVFDFSSRKLDYINQYLGLPVKEHTGFELWKQCYFGNPEALHTMELYNRNDCEILEDLYLRFRPYIRSHPNLNLWSVENVSICPNCASKNLDWSVKEYFTYTGKYKGFRCLDCGATGRSRQLELDLEKRKTIVR
jgi:hypothetical protein